MTITVEMIAHSTSANEIPIATMKLRYPKFIHGEFMTHRVFSRNASSSRAIPVERLIEDVMNDPAMPLHWGKNQPGMQAREEHDEEVASFYWRLDGHFWRRQSAWLFARDNAVATARAFARAGYHKQIVNRLLEPWCHINVVVTATEWENFFALRCHPDAQPEMRVLAEEMRRVLRDSEPRFLETHEWHLPFVSTDLSEIARDKPEHLDTNEVAVRISTARCARVSYLTQEGRVPNIAQDLDLYARLVGSVPLHASPAEHQAHPDRYNDRSVHGNFNGWIQHRKLLELRLKNE